MTEFVEFGSLAAANNSREEFAEFVCPVDDDRRQKTVGFVSDTPPQILDAIRADATEDRNARESGDGQLPLTDRERERIDFSEDGANVPKARSVKGIARTVGVEEWPEAFDPRLSVDEHRDVLESFNRSTVGDRVEGERGREREREAAARQQDQQCRHAEGACQNGDPDACEFLQEVCGFSQPEVNDLLPVTTNGGMSDESAGDPLVVDATAIPDPDDRLARPPVDTRDDTDDETDDDDPPEPEIDEQQGRLSTDPFVEEGADLSGPQYRGLTTAATSYRAAVSELQEALETAKEQMEFAQSAAKAISGIREEAGQPPTHFRALEKANAALLDLVRMSAETCVECHAEHRDHDHEVTDGDLEDLREFVGAGGPSTDVGVSDETAESVAESVNAPVDVGPFSLSDSDPDSLVWEERGGTRRVEVYSHGGSMRHHYTAMVTGPDRDGDELAVVDRDRPAEDDDGRRENREAAIEAATEYMRAASTGDEMAGAPDPGPAAGGGAVIEREGGQGTLGGGTTGDPERTTLAVEPDVRQSQGQESRIDEPESEGGLLEDTRADPDRGPDTNDPDPGEQDSLGSDDPDSEQLGGFNE